ncbi:MAG: 2-dehydropantoate 2-reductase [Candidatus Omnitrophota bacterium]
MRIAVIGSGAIGCLLAGYLKLKGEDVYLAGRGDSLKAILSSGLGISGVRGDFNVPIAAGTRLSAPADLFILATKTADIEGALKDNLEFVQGKKVLSTQNGIAAEQLIAKYTAPENIISGIVMFGATYLEPGKVVHNFEGSLVLGSLFGFKPSEEMVKISLVLDKAFPAIISEEIKGAKYLKIFANANNCLPALLGLSMQEVFKDENISRISIAVWQEGYNVISKAGIKLASLPNFTVENITRLISLPRAQAAGIFSGIMGSLSKEPLYGSILQSIKRKRPSEIDYINGEFVRLAQECKTQAPLNSRLVKLVHQVEETGRFLTKEELFDSLSGVI